MVKIELCVLFIGPAICCLTGRWSTLWGMSSTGCSAAGIYPIMASNRTFIKPHSNLYFLECICNTEFTVAIEEWQTLQSHKLKCCQCFQHFIPGVMSGTEMNRVDGCQVCGIKQLPIAFGQIADQRSWGVAEGCGVEGWERVLIL